ncbi:hypothetical protein EV644_11992 [Kribbella orskensis]|uniref:Syndecan 1 n=2 Tax=Kribbellaceae TaxID=2726069 RepID=A0ABY2BBK2_9ACTN|nr:hypothetical protein EV642_12051 [Kribbella sp. VKM Ac-2500]TCO14979.1 hypothetical protein EV644_11992 [Kribbella orskensis]
MRWPFHRDTTPSPDTGVGAGVGGGDSGAGSAEARAGWRELPPLQRSTADLAPIAPAASFRESLAAHQDPRFLAPLGHSLVVDAPAGEVGGYATPVSEVPSKVSFPHPPSVDISGTTAGSAPVGLQRAVDGGSSSPVPRAFSLPAATTFVASELPAVEPRPVPATPVPVTPAPVTSVSASSLPVVQTSPDPVASPSVPTVPSAPSAPRASSAPVVSRSVESHDQSHHDHTQHEHTEHEHSEHEHTEHEHAAHEQTLAGQGAEVLGAPVQEMPLVGLSEPLGQSPFVSALGGPEPGPSVQRAVEAVPVVKRAADAELVVHRVAEVGPVAPRAVEVQREVPEASVTASSKPVAHRWLQPEFALQRAAESGGVVSGGSVSGGSVAGWSLSGGGSGDVAAVSAPAMPVPVVPDNVAGAAVAQRAVDGGLPVHQVQRAVGGEPIAPEVQRTRVDEPSRGTRSEVGLVGQREMAVQRAVEAESVGRDAADRHPARIAGIGPVLQGVGEGAGGVQRVVEGATGTAGPIEQGRAEAVQRSIVRGGAAAAHGAGMHGAARERVVQRAVDVGPVVARAVAAPAELLWPPQGGVDEGEMAPLSSALPLTVPEVQRPVSVAVGNTPPAVQRVVYGHPGLGSPASPPRATPQAPSLQTAPATQAAQVPASVGQGSADGDVLSWSLGDSFHAGEPVEPAVQRADVVRSVSLQQMFSGHAMTAPAEADHAVQRDEALQEAPAVQTAEPAPAPAVAPVPAPAAGAAAGGGAKTVSAAEVEELAKRLYEPLTAKLRAELWLDRERAGRVTDRW